MTYSIDLRKRVVAYIEGGGRKTEAVKLFGVGRKTIYSWLSRNDLAPKSYERTKPRKMDWSLLREHVRDHPEMLSTERSAHFGVTPASMCYALKQMKITRKKSS